MTVLGEVPRRCLPVRSAGDGKHFYELVSRGETGSAASQ